jgi:hypothetical protein
MREIRDEKLDFWIKNNLNVLFIGHYGTGKTTRILEAFERNHLKYKYFSASTMDPWCDFIGVPKTISDDRGPYLDYILPRDLRDDSIEAIYMDEFNRSHKKVRNAVMELLQFKSINGRPFKKLRMIWAAINPEDGEYQVEALDPAQKDRFQVQVQIPYEPSIEFFTNKFDRKQAKAAIDWWRGLTPELQMEVSPRRLEYALQMYNLEGGSMKDVLPHACNPSKLSNILRLGPIDDRMKEIYRAKDLVAATKFMQVENNYASAQKYFSEPPDSIDLKDWSLFFLQSLPSEKLHSLMASNEEAYNLIIKNYDAVPIFRKGLKEIITADTDKTLIRRIKKEVNIAGLTDNAVTQAEKPYFSKNKSNTQWSVRIAGWVGDPIDTTPQRAALYSEIVHNLPQVMTAGEAVDTLELLNMIAARCHGNKLKEYSHLMGVINHCIDQIHKQGNLSWSEIQTNYGMKFSKLLDKLADIGFDKKLLCPIKQKTA